MVVGIGKFCHKCYGRHYIGIFFLALLCFYRGKIGGKWDVSMGYIDLEFDPNNVKCTVDDFDAGNEGVNALVKMILNDPEAKRQMVEAFKSEMNVDDFNGSLDIEFDGDNVMKLTGTDGVVLTFHRQ